MVLVLERETKVLILLLFINCLTLGCIVFVVCKLFSIEQDMIKAKIQHEITQQIPIRRRK